ncbi:MAG: hypothetical protein ACR2NP_04180 [Pirellulaceae bacterium]
MTSPDSGRAALVPLAALMLMVALPNLTVAQQGKFVRPERFAPPVHAQPLRQQNNLAPVVRTQPQYPVRQVAATQQTIEQQSDQWRTRGGQAVQDTTNRAHGTQQPYATQQPYSDSMPTLSHPAPQQHIPAPSATGQWSMGDSGMRPPMAPSRTQPPQIMAPQENSVMQPYAMPDTAVPELQFGDTPAQALPNLQPTLEQPQSAYTDSGWNEPELTSPQYAGESMQQMAPVNDQFANPTMETSQYAGQGIEQMEPAAEQYVSPSMEMPTTSPQTIPQDNSVLVRDDPQLNSNQRRGRPGEPRRMRPDQWSTRQQAMPAANRKRVPGTLTRQDFGDEPIETEQLKSCDDYRSELLDSPITDIIVDISPVRPSAAAQTYPAGMTRTWTDCTGHALATGTLTGLRGSYVTITENTGGIRLVPMSLLSDGDLNVVTEFWGLPTECTLGCDPFLGRHWACNSVLWKASALCHKPLYFENIQLERYGHTHGPVVEPIHSTAHFFCSLLFWPYQAGIHPPHECVYALGYYRPGDCAPWLKDPIPLSLDGAKNQLIFTAATAAIIIP